MAGELLAVYGSSVYLFFGQNDWCTFCCQPKQKSAFLANFHHRAAFVSIINILAGSTGQGSDNIALFNSLEINSYFLKTFKVTRYPRNVDFMLVPSLTLEKLVSRHDPNDKLPKAKMRRCQPNFLIANPQKIL